QQSPQRSRQHRHSPKFFLGFANMCGKLRSIVIGLPLAPVVTTLQTSERLPGVASALPHAPYSTFRCNSDTLPRAASLHPACTLRPARRLSRCAAHPALASLTPFACRLPPPERSCTPHLYA